tara:strand:+ start:505 stop:678 length:174 start_codon:yes stop_codon:yes gene_type:complete
MSNQPVIAEPNNCTINAPHCSQCGEANPQVDEDDYTDCCNEVMADNARECYNHHSNR